MYLLLQLSCTETVSRRQALCGRIQFTSYTFSHASGMASGMVSQSVCWAVQGSSIKLSWQLFVVRIGNLLLHLAQSIAKVRFKMSYFSTAVCLPWYTCSILQLRTNLRKPNMLFSFLPQGFTQALLHLYRIWRH